jgi:regulator of protease activity HflC (stomatin/prohibitin superfamily)
MSNGGPIIHFPKTGDSIFESGKYLFSSGGLLVLVALALAFTSIYTVQAESQGVVLRFGRYVKIVDPGLHFKIPLGIDTVTILPVRRQLKQEFGFSTEGATNINQYSSLESKTMKEIWSQGI